MLSGYYASFVDAEDLLRSNFDSQICDGVSLPVAEACDNWFFCVRENLIDTS